MPDNSLSILVACRSFPAHRAGGMEWHAHDVAQGLIAAGHTVHILTTPLPHTPVLAPLETNGEIVELGGGGLTGLYTRAWFRQAAPAAERLCKKHGIDLIHAQGLAGIPLTLTGHPLPPVVTTVHGTLFSETPLYRRARARLALRDRIRMLWRFKHRLGFWPFWKAFLAARPHLIVDSEFTRRELLRSCETLEPHLVPLGMDMGRYPEPDGLEPREGAVEGVPLLFTVGRLERVKGVHLLLDALALLRERPWNLAIGGDGPERKALERQAGRLGLEARVRFTGRLEDDALARWMARADLFLNADQGYPAFGLVNAEAQVMGCPVGASAHGAHPEVVENEAPGFLIRRAHRPNVWARAIASALEGLPEEETARRGRAVRARQQFESRRMVERLEEIYRLVLAGKR